MKHWMRVSLTVLFLGAVASADDVRVVVGFKGKPDLQTLAKAGGSGIRTLSVGSAVSAMIPASAVSKLRRDENVSYVEEDGVVRASAKPTGTTSQPPQQTPWGVTKVNAPLSGNVGAGIKVAVIDTGIDLDHPDLAGNIKGSVDFTGSRKGADDENGHGTHVAGTIAALNNTIGVVGVAPGAHLYAVRVLDRRGYGWTSDIAQGVSWCKNNGMNVANMSLGGPSSDTTLQTACDAAAGTVLLIAAAGNSGDGNLGTNEVEYPAYYSSVVSVGATDSGDGLASFSCTNGDLELSGPGVSVLSTYKGGAYATGSGTSMASPHAAGVAALLWKGMTTPSASAVRTALQQKARDVNGGGQDNGYGYGIVWYQ